MAAGEFSRRAQEIFRDEIILQAEQRAQIARTEARTAREPRGIEPAHLLADDSKQEDRRVRLIGEEVCEDAHRPVIVLIRQPVGQLISHRLRHPVRHGQNVRARDRVALHIGRDLVDLRDHGVHQPAGKENELAGVLG